MQSDEEVLAYLSLIYSIPEKRFLNAYGICWWTGLSDIKLLFVFMIVCILFYEMVGCSSWKNFEKFLNSMLHAQNVSRSNLFQIFFHFFVNNTIKSDFC